MKDQLQAQFISQFSSVMIEYPKSFPLIGTDRILFDYQLKKMFRRGSVCASTMNGLYKKLGDHLEPQGEKNRENVEALYWEDFKDLPSDILRLLPTLIGTSLGLQIHLPMLTGPVISERNAASQKELIIVPGEKQAISAPGESFTTPEFPIHATPLPQIKQDQHNLGAAVGGVLLMLALFGIALTFLPTQLNHWRKDFGNDKASERTAMESKKEDTLNATVSTSAVRISLSRMASAVKNDGTIYKVHVTVTPE